MSYINYYYVERREPQYKSILKAIFIIVLLLTALGVLASDSHIRGVLKIADPTSVHLSETVNLDAIQLPNTRAKAGKPHIEGIRSVSLLNTYAIVLKGNETASGVFTKQDDYFEDALFIGDSRTEALYMYSKLVKATFYFSKGMSVTQFFDKENLDIDGVKMTASDALARKSFGKVYIMLGINELGWPYPEEFIKRYGLVIDRIKETQPKSLIIVESILPVTANLSDKHEYRNNPKINTFNDLIKTMAQEKEIVYMDVNAYFADESGALPEASTVDGIHLNKEYCKIWEEYLRTH